MTNKDIPDELREELEEHTVDFMINDGNRRNQYMAIFKQGQCVCYNQLIERLREKGYEIYSFGKNNRKYPDNFTGTFVKND